LSWVLLVKVRVNGFFYDADGVRRLLMEIDANFFKNGIGNVVGWMAGDNIYIINENTGS
jgi:hypothetical protein